MSEKFPSQLNPSEVPQITIQPFAQQMEIVTRAINTAPGALGEYLRLPAREPYSDSEGRTQFRNAAHTELEEVKQNLANAAINFDRGDVGSALLMYGSINGSYDAHKGSNIPNLREAFEQFDHFNITGSSNYHNMFNPSGNTVGKLELELPKNGVGKENAATLARGAVSILDGATSVMFKGFEDKPHDKMYGIKDPETGELLPNTFMVIMSGTFADKEGTSSWFSSIASARIVIIPDEILAKARIPEESKSDFVMNNDDWNLLEDGHFKVIRSDGSIQKGWMIREIIDENGVEKAIITGWDEKRGPVRKTVSLEELLSWQKQDQPTP